MSQEPLAKTALPDANLAYLAGFFDGEGHIRIQKHSARGNWMLQITVVQAELNPLPRFKDAFGGTIAPRILKYRGGERALFTWQSSSSVAENALRAMLPYLSVKLDEAKVAIGFRESFRPKYGDRSRLPEQLVEWRRTQMIALQDIRKDKRRAGFIAVKDAVSQKTARS